jgi:signal transduction histidine kinase
MIVLLPLSAAFSFLVARPVTRRLEALAAAASALRAGDYKARVPVKGEDEVARLQADFNAMAGTLEHAHTKIQSERDTTTQALRTRRDLVASVSHELRTPVATLQAAVETTLDDWESLSPEKIRECLIIMQDEIRGLSGLIDDLFILSQAEVDNLPLAYAAVDPAELIGQVVEAFAPLAWKSGRVEVAADLPKNLPLVWSDNRRLHQVLMNLLRNAVRHTPPGGVVAVLAKVEGDNVRIEVRDTGEGIDPLDLQHIWERFFRGRNAAEGSAGLGLALVKELVEAMGGSVAVESAPGQGSCFFIRLPKALRP